MNGLCLTVDADDWDRGQIPERIRLQAALAEAVETACIRSGFTVTSLHSMYSANGLCLVLPDGRNPAASVPALLGEFVTALARTNETSATVPRMRLRVALTTGLVLPPGIAGRAVAEGLRLVNSHSVKAALRRMPASDLAVIVSDTFYRDTVGPGLQAFRPQDCSPVRLGRGVPRTAWLHAPGLPLPNPRPAPTRWRDADVQYGSLLADADRLVDGGDHRRAIKILEEALRLLPDPDLPNESAQPDGPDGPVAERALLMLGDCYQRLGEVEAAAQTWQFLLTRQPLSAAACRRLGRLELRRGRADLAPVYLNEGLRLVRAHPGLSATPGSTACALLLDLSHLEEALENHAAADVHLNEAAEADPLSPLPLVSLAYRAARDGDVDATRRLLGTALARVPTADRAGFLHEQSKSTATRRGGDVIMELLLENGLDPAVSHRH